MATAKIILLVEDDANDLQLIERSFRKAGLDRALKVVRDGEQATDYLSGRGIYADRERFPLPFLLLLDLKMPGMNGFDLLQWVRMTPGLERLLIVVLTASNLQADVDRAYELGANSYLVKPVEFEQMANMIQRFEMYWTELNRTPTGPSLEKSARPETITS